MFDLAERPRLITPETCARTGTRFVPLEAAHLLDIVPQPSQQTQYGLRVADMTRAEAQAQAEQDHCWAALAPDGRVLACMGINETFPGAQGVAWALFAQGLHREYVPITDFARRRIIGASALPRIEAVVRCADMEDFRRITACEFDDEMPWKLQERVLRRALAMPTPQVSWALRVGLTPVAVLRKFGGAAETHMLLERIA